VVGIALAFLGILPPVWAAAAQSLPDVAIMLNSARLLRRT
jgi:Cu+-exporting ATPase